MVFMIESQIDYVWTRSRHLDDTRARAVEVTPEAQDAFERRDPAAMKGTVWTDGGCSSWYLDANGRNSTLWPDFTFRFAGALRRFDPAEHVGEPATAPVPAEVAA